MRAWDQASYNKLWAATTLAAEAGQSSFSLDLGRKKGGRLTFDTVEALDLCETLRVQFDANPMPIFGENREGREP
jgi:hypothetical protein